MYQVARPARPYHPRGYLVPLFSVPTSTDEGVGFRARQLQTSCLSNVAALPLCLDHLLGILGMLWCSSSSNGTGTSTSNPSIHGGEGGSGRGRGRGHDGSGKGSGSGR
jgi:hypothetical protein